MSTVVDESPRMESTEPLDVDHGPGAAIESRIAYLGAAVACAAMVGSLYFSEIRGYTPCALCWYQRAFMYPLALLLPVGLMMRVGRLPYLGLALSLIGGAISFYHVLIQKTTIFSESIACSTGVPCSLQYINTFGFVTIPILALAAFVLIFFSMSAARHQTDAELPYGTNSTAWTLGAIVVGLIVGLFIGARA